MRKTTLFLFLLLCGGTALAAEDGSPSAHAAAALPAVAARFETTYCRTPCRKPVSRRWYLLRDRDTIELRGEGAPFSELWRRYPDGRIDYVYAMHDERRAIEYSPTDLVLIDRRPDWERIGALLSMRDLERLKAGKKGRHAGLHTRRYSGMQKEARVEVVWIPDLALPAKMQYRYPAETVTIRLLRRYEGAAPVAPVSAAALESYQTVDYSDVGDMEEDPQAQAWIRKAAAAPGHLHHGHGH